MAKPLVKLPIEATIDYKKTKTEVKKVIEFDPTKIKAGEAVIIQVPKWGGLSNQCFVVLNIDGKRMRVACLRKTNPKER